MKSQFPVDSFIEDIISSLENSSSVVIQAEPGAGKTTRVPVALSKRFGRTIVLEPRRIAAIAAAHRVAEESQFRLGGEVGYRVRFDNKTSKESQLIFVTEALLSREILNDPDLTNFKVVVLDEFHERNIHTDIAIGYLKELQLLSRPDLKIVVMSATLDAARVSKYLETDSIFEIPGKLFNLKLEMQKSPQKFLMNREFYESTSRSVRDFILKNEKNLKSGLIFLPGAGEIQRLETACAGFLNEMGFDTAQLYGEMRIEDQAALLKRSGRRVAIFCTNVAESAITVEGVNWVIDSGLKKEMTYDPFTGVSQLKVGRISKSSAKQRAGRSARLEDGFVLRLWTSQDEYSFKEFDQPEILKVELSETLLLMFGLGIKNPNQFSWYESPKAESLKKSVALLKSLSLIDENLEITPLGKSAVNLPLTPRLSHFFLNAKKFGESSIASDICAILQEREALLSDRSITDSVLLEFGCDLFYRLSALKDFRQNRTPNDFSRFRLATIDRVSKSLSPFRPYEIDKELERVKLPLIQAYFDCVARRRTANDSAFKMVTGSGARLSKDSLASESEFVLALSMFENSVQGETQISMATPLSLEVIKSALQSKIEVKSRYFFDGDAMALKKGTSEFIGEMAIGSEKLSSVNPAEAKAHLLDIVVSMSDEIAKKNQPLLNFRTRVQFLESQLEKTIWSKEQESKAWEAACYNETSVRSIIEKDLVYFFMENLEPEWRESLNRLCPTQLKLANGTTLDLHYHSDKNPHAEVLLQDLFGCNSHPFVFDGKVPVTLHILAPNKRPVQVTGDLLNFWKSSYFEVKKELRIRYSKHQWPDDPISARPIRLKKNL